MAGTSRDGAQGEPWPAVEVVGQALPRSGCAAATHSLLRTGVRARAVLGGGLW